MKKSDRVQTEFKHYVYIHTRLDLGVPFYVGVGTTDKWKYFNRAFSKQRNVFWKRIFDKTEIEVYIVLETNDYSEALIKESELIKKYGRIINGGTLCNLTDGGEGTLGFIFSEETRLKFRKRQLGKKLSTETKSRITESLKKRYDTKGSSKGIRIYQYSINGIFMKEWKSMAEANIHYGFKTNVVFKALLKINNYGKGYLWFGEFKGQTISVNKNNNFKTGKVVQYDLLGNVINIFENVTKASENLCGTNLYRNQIGDCCKGLRENFKNYIWNYEKNDIC